MNFSMVILNYNDSIRAYELACKCSKFDSIQKVVIIDNCSTDNSYKYLKDKENETIKVIRSPKNGGFAYGNTVAAKYLVESCNPEYILFANTDTIFNEEDVIKALEQLNNDEKLGLISLRVLSPNGEEENSCWRHKTFKEFLLNCFWIYRRKHFKDYLIKSNDETMSYVDVVRGSWMLFKANALVDANYFDDNTFLYYEEDIIAQRLQRANYKVGVMNHVFYIHNHIQSNNNNYPRLQKILYTSLSYYLENYYELNSFKKFIARLVIKYAYFEDVTIYKIKKLLKK